MKFLFLIQKLSKFYTLAKMAKKTKKNILKKQKKLTEKNKENNIKTYKSFKEQNEEFLNMQKELSRFTENTEEFYSKNEETFDRIYLGEKLHIYKKHSTYPK